MPDALHTVEQRGTCEKRLLADLSRSWPRTVKTRAELDARAAKKLRCAADALTEAMQVATLTPAERVHLAAAVNVLVTHIEKQTKG